MAPSLAFVCAIGASMFWLQGCGSSDSPAPSPSPPSFDCHEAYRQKCFNEMPFSSCCDHDCGGGSGGQTCEVQQQHTLSDDTQLNLTINFQYDIGDDNCQAACGALKNAHWYDFCDGCGADCVLQDPHVQNCSEALSQITPQTSNFCGSSSHISVEAVAKDEDFCKQAYYAGCWREVPFNAGCCASTCDASAGMETCQFTKDKNQHGGSAIHLNIDFKYDPDDDKCKNSCKAISTAMWSDYCDGTIGGDGALSHNLDVMNCAAAMKSIHDQVHAEPDWCGASLTEQIV